jgi:stage IV sporulation protein FB
MPIIKVNYLTYLLLLLIVFLCGYFKNAIIIMIIMLFHELGHVIFSYIFKYKILEINFYPFGGIIKYNNLINSSFWSDFFVFSGGLFFQIILYFIINNINLNFITLNMFNNYNKLLFIFNILPIIPLDGSILLNLLLNKFICFKKSYYVSGFISIFTLILFIIINIQYSLNNYLIYILIVSKTIYYFKNFKYIYNKFLLERYLYNIKYRKINNSYYEDINIFYKDVKEYFYINHNWVDERTFLGKRFDKRTYY